LRPWTSSEQELSVEIVKQSNLVTDRCWRDAEIAAACAKLERFAAASNARRPILNIYRKYYGPKMAAVIFATFYASMAATALVVEVIYDTEGFSPSERNAQVLETSISWKYTTWLNIVFLALAGLLVRRFLKTSGPEMLLMMNMPAQKQAR
jgi:hypothetical protein